MTSPLHRVSRASSFGLQRQLLILVFVALLPMLLMGALTAWFAGTTLRKASSRQLQDTALALTRVIDDGIQHHIRSLQWLAPGLAAGGDPEQATRQWRRIMPDADHRAEIVLARPGEPAPLPSAFVKATLAADAPLLSDIFRLPGDPVPRIALAMPLTPGSDTLLALVQPSTHIIGGIHENVEHLLLAVTDSQGRLAARSRDPGRFLGQPVPDWDTLISHEAEQGVFSARTTEGEGVVLAFHKLQSAPGWAVVAGEPQQTFRTRWLLPLLSILLGGTLSALLAFVAATRVARRILQPVQALVRHSRAVARGDQHIVAPTGFDIEEFEALRAGLAEAEAALRQRAHDARQLADTLACNERRYRSIAETGALVFWRADADGHMQALTGWREFTGQHETESTGQGWLRHVHADDLPQVERAWAQARAEGRPLDVEFRVLDDRGSERWVRARGAPVDPTDPHWNGVFEDVGGRRRAQAHVDYLTRHDTHTGLANQAQLHERLRQAQEQARLGRTGALLYIDLDRVKDVNDALGHAIGDALLRAAAARLQRGIQEPDMAARLYGATFAVLQAEGRQPEAARTLAQRLAESLRAPYDIEGQRIVIDASIGIAMIDADAASPEQTMRHADLALHRAARTSHARLQLYEPD